MVCRADITRGVSRIMVDCHQKYYRWWLAPVHLEQDYRVIDACCLFKIVYTYKTMATSTAVAVSAMFPQWSTSEIGQLLEENDNDLDKILPELLARVVSDRELALFLTYDNALSGVPPVTVPASTTDNVAATVHAPRVRSNKRGDSMATPLLSGMD